MVFDRPLGVGAAGGHGSIRYSVIEYELGRRIVFRFAPDGGLAGVHGFELEPVGTDRTSITHFLDAEAPAWMRPLVPILIGWHDAMVETAGMNGYRRRLALYPAERRSVLSFQRASWLPR